MTLTFLELYNECASQPWSMFDNDAESKEDFESAMRTSINKAASFLWSLQPWSFRFRTTTIKTKSGKANYDMPEGTIVEKSVGVGDNRYGVKYNGSFLLYEPSYELLDEREGEPETFYVDGDTLYIYPTPDDVYQINITYLALPYALSSDDEEIYELKEDDDYIDIPERYESMFKNCLISLAMIYVIADESDENHLGYVKQYEDSLKVLMQYCAYSVIGKYISW